MRHTAKDDYVVTFWGPDRSGYTPDLNKAGLYTEDQINKICDEDHRQDDFPIGEKEALSNSVLREYNYNKWEEGKFILNDEVFWNTYNIDYKRMFVRGGNQKQYFRYCKG